MDKFKEVIIKILTPVHNFIKKIQYNSPLILTYTIVSFVVLLLDIATGNKLTNNLFSVYRSPLADPLTYVRIFGYAFGHANFEHFFNNFLLVLLIGPPLEEKYGWKKLLFLMFTAVIITGIIHMVLSPDKRLLGASGVVFMMIVLSSFVNLKEGMVPFTLILSIIVFIGKEVMSGVMLADNVSRMTHITGGILGAVFGIIINREKLITKKPKEKKEKRHKKTKDSEEIKKEIKEETEPDEEEQEEIIYMTDKKPSGDK